MVLNELNHTMETKNLLDQASDVSWWQHGEHTLAFAAVLCIYHSACGNKARYCLLNYESVLSHCIHASVFVEAEPGAVFSGLRVNIGITLHSFMS